MRTLFIAAALLVNSVALAQTSQMNQPQVQAQVLQTKPRLQFVPPPELAAKPNRPQMSAPNAYTAALTITGLNGQKQPWTVTVPLRSYVQGIAVSHAIVSPRDAASGLPTGKRMHKPLTITVENGAATPLINHIKANEVITQVTMTFTPIGTNAISHVLLINNPFNSKLTQLAEYIEIAMVFQKITWTWTDGGKSSSDDWEAPPP